ncbi:MAG TPA: hemerythrin domain-containing protein [Kofleriaceae bacterium]|nr:hemerythrin domain-containing protein [Kofleriaceae bacterium]
MSIIELIKREHDEVGYLFDHLLALARDHRHANAAARCAARLVTLVRVHSHAEERVFYEALRTKTPELKAFALAGPHEHEVIDTTIDKLLVRQPGDDEYRIIVRVARDLFQMHARDEEETDILPLVAEAFPADEQEALAVDMLAEEARIRPQILRLIGAPARAA